MIPIFIQDLWKNKILRYTFLGFISLLLIAIVLKFRFSIYKLFAPSYHRMNYRLPITWDRPPYGFTENPEEAKELLEEALENLADLAEDTYDADWDHWKKKQVSLTENWQDVYTKPALIAVNYLLSDMELFCIPPMQEKSVRVDFYRKERLKKRHLKFQEEGKFNPFLYAIKKDNYEDIREDLLDIRQKQVETALGYKPDARTLLQFYAKLSEALCRSYDILPMLQTAISYREYAAEKKLYFSLHNHPDFTPDFLDEKLWEHLRKDNYYFQLQKELLYFASRMSSNLKWKLQRIRQSLNLRQDPSLLNTYFDTLMIYVSTLSKQEAKKVSEELSHFPIKKVLENPAYLMASATAYFYAGELDKAKMYVKSLLLRPKKQIGKYYY
ncbi:MAG: hypothetical protein D6767_07620, partial [Candidatus Hydrogenedentota bacterium]